MLLYFVIPNIIKFGNAKYGRSSHLIAYVCHPGKARDFLDYAERKNLRIERIIL